MRQSARRRVLEALAVKQKQREAQERRLQTCAVAVLTALAERDDAIDTAEQQAATAISAMLAEGLTLAEITGWCDGLAAREVTRLSRLAPTTVSP